MRRLILTLVSVTAIAVATVAPAAATHTDGGRGFCPNLAGDPEPFGGSPGTAPDRNGDGLICNVRSQEGTPREKIAATVDNNVADLGDLPEHPHDEPED